MKFDSNDQNRANSKTDLAISGSSFHAVRMTKVRETHSDMLDFATGNDSDRKDSDDSRMIKVVKGKLGS